MRKKKNLFVLFLATLFSITQILAQESIIKGKIVAEDGEPLIGATIAIKGQSGKGTATDVDGNFSLAASQGSVLVITYVGFETTESIVTSSTMHIVLSPQSQILTEVVAVGYGVQKKVDMTGSVSTVKGDMLLKAPSPNLTNALAGKMTGVISTQQSGKPGLDDPIFSIRGKSTLGDNSALLLVDGIERSISKLDPNEIESVTILKDAASAAVYGARGANGVILVTTKRGGQGKTKINYTATFGLQSPTVVPKMMNAYEYAKYLNLALVNFGNLPRFTEEQIEGYRNGSSPSTDWWKETLKKRAGTQMHSLTANGGNETTKYFISLGLLDQDGLYDLSSFKKYNVRSNIDTKVTKEFTVSLDLAGRYEKISESALGDGLFSSIIGSKPTERAYVPTSVDPDGLGDNGLNTSPIGVTERVGYHKVENSVFQSTLKGVYEAPFLKGLKASASFSFDRWFSRDKTFQTPFEFYKYDRILDKYNKTKSGGGINLYEGRAEDQRLTYQASLMYDNSFLDQHNVSALFVLEESSYKYNVLSAARVNFISPEIEEIFAGPTLDLTNGGSSSETVRRGYVGRLNYNYEGKYLFQFNFRYDGSFNFPAGKRWGFFPAVSGGWRLSEERFMKNNKIFHNLKLRASYGEFGNDRISAYQFLSGYTPGSGAVIGGNFQSGITDTSIANPNVTWETARNTDVGIDFSILGGKISSELTYFHKKTVDILTTRAASVPTSFGAILPPENLGETSNRGIEAIVRYEDKVGDFGYSIEGNVTWAKSKILFIDEASDVKEWQRRTGRPFDQFLGYKAMGFFQSQEEINNWAIQDGNNNSRLKVGDIKYDDYDKNGVIDGRDKVFVGKSQIPEVIFGLNLAASYKQFDLAMSFQGATGFDQYMTWDPFNLESNALAIFKDSWSEDNPNAKYPRLYAGTYQNNREDSSFWLYDGTYVRLRNIELAYTFSKHDFLKKVGIQGLRIFVSGNNILTFSKMKDFDPEAPSIKPGEKQYYYPQMKTYNFGFNLEF